MNIKTKLAQSSKRWCYSGIILCGGQSSRMGYKNKCFLKIKGETFIEIIIRKLKNIVSEVILVTKDRNLYSHLEDSHTIVVEDILKKQSSLTGIHTGLMYAQNYHSFITGCDTPLIKTEIIEILLKETSYDIDIVVPRIGKYIEPLCAVYSKRCVPVIEKMLKNNCFQIKTFYKFMKVKEINENTIKGIDPHLYSFLNINTHEDYEKLLKIDLHTI